MARLTLSLLGPLEVKLGDEPVTGLATSKVRALLAYLAVESDRPHSREVLAGLLWPDWPQRSARTNLRNALSTLRSAIGDRGADADPPYLLVTRETLQFNRQSDHWLDVAAFGDLVQAGAEDQLEAAVALYRGPFLEGFSVDDSPAYEDWALVVRERLQRQALGVLQRLAGHYAQRGEYARACEAAWRQVELEPWQEEAHRELMRLLSLNGQRSAALAQYEACRRALREALGVEPGEETTLLYQQIRDGKLAPPRQQAGDRTIDIGPRDASPPPISLPSAQQRPVPLPPAQPAAIPQSPAALDGERRLATAILADVQGSTSLFARIGTEVWVEIMNQLFQVLGAEIYRYGGEIDQFRGDGLLAFFGVSATHENDPERAVLAALGMQEAVRRFAAELAEQDIQLELRVGVNTGEVIAAAIGDRRQHREQTAMGEAIALAARMEAAAEPGTVLVTENTYRLVAPLFEWQPLGEITVKGISEPLAVYRPLAHKLAMGKGRGIAGLSSPLVGRRSELDALKGAVERLQSGMGGIVTLVSDAGIGKSRLVAECRDAHTAPLRHERPSPQWVEGRCLSYATNVAYQLWADMLRSLLGVAPDAPTDAVREALQGWVRRLCPDCVEDVYPYLGRMLALDLGDELEARLRGLGAEGLRVGTFRAVETFLESAARRRPLIVVGEDLHWADATSLALLEQALGLTDRVPLLLICVLRPETEHGCWRVKETASRDYRHRHTDLWLDPLSIAESETLVGNLLHVENLPDGLRARILARAEGNPFYVEEIIRSLLEDGTIVRAETGHWIGTRDVADVPIPDTVHGVLMARIDRLPRDTKRTLQLAAVIGRVFTRPVLAAVTEPDLTLSAVVEGAQGETLDAHLLILQRGQMIRERTRVPEVEYIFKHVLMQEAAYRSLLRRERRLFHRRAAEALERLYSDRVEELVGLLAHHWEQAGDPEWAIPYLLRAGDPARLAYANEEALAIFRRALALLDEPTSAASEAKALDGQREGWRLKAVKGLGLVWLRMGRLQEAEERLCEAIALGRKIGLEVRELVQLYHWLGGVMFWQGRYEDKIRIGEEGLALLGDDIRSLEAALMYQSIASGYWMTQNWEGFQAFASRMAQFIHDLPYVPELRPAHLSVIDLYRFCEKNIEEASRWREVLEQKAAQHHDLTALGDAHMYAARICAAQGDLSGAIPRYQQALELFTRVGDIKEGCGAQIELGDRYLDVGDIETAEACFCASLAMAQKLENPKLIASSYQDSGRAFVCRGDWEKAAGAFRQARRIRHELDSPPEEMWVAFLQGKALLAQGNRPEAWRHFQRMGALLTPGQLELDPADLAYVLSALEEASTEPAEFRAFSRLMQEEARDGGPGEPRSPTLAQWFLEPTDVHTVDQTPLHRDAFADLLSPGWAWRDPFGDCSFKVGDGLQIHAANGRHIRRINLSAPRMERSALGNWVVQTICGPVLGPIHLEQKPDIGGLLTWVDEQNYLCLVKGLYGKREIGFWGCLDSRDIFIGRGRMAPGKPADGLDHGLPVYLRLERVEDRVRALCSADGVNWFTAGSVTFPIADTVQLGMVAIGSIDRTVYCGAYPDGTAIRFESFDLWRAPASESAD